MNMMYSKLLLCTICRGPYARIEVDSESDSQTETYGECYTCNLAALRSAPARETIPQTTTAPVPQQVIQSTGIQMNVPTCPPLELVAQEPDVIEYRDQDVVILTWRKHVDAETGLRYYEDQNGNKWHYQKL
jgi:hypothetical protein